MSTSISGSPVPYAGGGGGNGGYYGGPSALGGSGRGGAGGVGATSTGANGSPNTGGGSGGSTDNLSVGNSGGSGIVIIKIPSTNTATFSGGVTGTTPSTSVIGFKIYTITNTTTTSETVTFS